MSARVMDGEPVVLSPTLRAEDELANFWLRQVTLRLRREITWIWHERGVLPGGVVGELPPFGSRVQEALDFARFQDDKESFFALDTTAAFLSDLIDESQPDPVERKRGSFAWIAAELDLDDQAKFVLALGLAAALDGAIGHVVAACLNDQGKTRPTLALAQRLWDRPDHFFSLVDPGHGLMSHGLLSIDSAPTGSASTQVSWDAPLSVPAAVATRLLFPSADLPRGLVPLSGRYDVDLDSEVEAVMHRLVSSLGRGLCIVPVEGRRGSSLQSVVTAISMRLERPVHVVTDSAVALGDDSYLRTLATVCWLVGSDLFLDHDLADRMGKDTGRSWAQVLPSPSLDLVVYVGTTDGAKPPELPGDHLLPSVSVGTSTYPERLEHWRAELDVLGDSVEPHLPELARRFRFERSTIDGIAAGLKLRTGPIGLAELVTACRSELSPDLGTLAQRVSPRFEAEELVLPPSQDTQFRELLTAAANLTRVHYEWGTADAWNEGGITALFAGPPGTGKTMAAEILARKLDVPMYRIDLSQVVNKYIGETEKNLKRVFDAADVSDTLLFFDEADALFGRRTEVKDAHDRHANLEISYLLERMERFKGLAVLATNRRRDLDEAFLRRLRFIIDFPLPDAAQREVIWRQSVPDGVDVSNVDFDFLAQKFSLVGGHIRSVVFNACLQSAVGEPAGREADRSLSMETLVVAVKREFDKLGRSVSRGSFGPYSEIVAAMSGDNETN